MRCALIAAVTFVRQFVRWLPHAQSRSIGWAFITVGLIVWVAVLAGPAAPPSQAQSAMIGPGITHLVVDQGRPQIVFASSGSDVFKSTDGGATWNRASSGLPGQPTGVPGASEIIEALAIDPSNGNTLYAAPRIFACSGGHACGGFGTVFKTTNGGATWSEIRNGFQSQLPITTLTVDPRDHQTVYAGTGNPGGSTFGNGIYKSVDAGASWQAVNSSAEFLDPSYVLSVAIDPTDSQTLYAATLRGGGGFPLLPRIFKTVNAGARWLLAGQPPEDFVTGVIAIDPIRPGTLYVGRSQSTGSSAIYKSTDAASTWSAASAGIPTGAQVTVLVFDPTGPGTLYASAFVPGSTSALFRSTDGAASWTAWGSGLDGVSILALVLDPSNPSTLYAGTDRGAYKSTDGGAHWAAMNGGLPTATPTWTPVTAVPPVGTSTVTPTPTVTPGACAPVRVTATPDGHGGLQVTVSAGTSGSPQNNHLRTLRFRGATNALIDIGGQVGRTGDFDVDLPSGTSQTVFMVRRATAGQPTTVPLTVTDDCGPWPTFVGGGPGAF